MTDPASQHASLPHAVFLQRMASGSGQAAFIVLRLVDLLGPEHATLHPDAFHYQYVATARCCRDLPPGATETSHLLGLVRSTSDAFRQQSTGLVLPALFAYAHYLEDEMRLEEALDVLETLLHVSGATLAPADAVGARLRRARVCRKLNAFDAAERAYTEGGEMAAAIGDRHSEMLSRLGQAETLRGRGNLSEAESALREILGDAERLGDTNAEAMAHQCIAVVLSTAGRPAEAIPHEWRAFQLYQDELSRIRTLDDLGVMLLTVGDAEGAERALTQVGLHAGSPEAVNNALIELMHCASFRRDRVGFERWRERCDARRDAMPRNVLVDYMLKAGIGRARFGQFDRAERLFASALKIADEAGLHEFTFRIERIRNGLSECQEICAATPELATELECHSEAVREVSASLARLGP